MASPAAAVPSMPMAVAAPPPYAAWDQQLTQMTTRLGLQAEQVDSAKYVCLRVCVCMHVCVCACVCVA
jgi:hypothetical protein